MPATHPPAHKHRSRISARLVATILLSTLVLYTAARLLGQVACPHTSHDDSTHRNLQALVGVVPVAYPAQHPNATAEGRLLDAFDPQQEAIAARPLPQPDHIEVGAGDKTDGKADGKLGRAATSDGASDGAAAEDPHTMPSDVLGTADDKPATFGDRLQVPKPRSATHYKPVNRAPGPLELRLGVPRVALLFLTRTCVFLFHFLCIFVCRPSPIALVVCRQLH